MKTINDTAFAKKKSKSTEEPHRVKRQKNKRQRNKYIDLYTDRQKKIKTEIITEKRMVIEDSFPVHCEAI